MIGSLVDTLEKYRQWRDDYYEVCKKAIDEMLENRNAGSDNGLFLCKWSELGKDLIADLSLPETELEIVVYNKLIKTGDKVNINIPSLNINGYRTVQQIDTSFSSNSNDVELTINLGDYIPMRKWIEGRKKERERMSLWDMFLRGVKRLSKKHLNFEFIDISYDNIFPPGFIIAMGKTAKYLSTSTIEQTGEEPPGHHTHVFDIDEPQDIDLT